MKQNKFLLLISFLCFSINAFGKESFFRDFNLKEKIKVESVGEIKVIKTIECKKDCVALKKIAVKDFSQLKKLDEKDYQDIYNPALILCDSMEGKLKTIFDQKKDAHSICEFSDESAFFSWDFLKQLEK